MNSKKWLLIGVLAIVAIVITGTVISNNAKEAAREEYYRLERQRVVAEAREKQAQELLSKIDHLYQGLDQAKTSLNDVSAFRLLRTKKERNAEIRQAQEIIKSYEDNIRALEEKILAYRPNYKSKL